MKHLIFFSILAASLWGLHIALTDPRPYTLGMGYLEEDRAALTAIMEEICGDNEGRYDCGYSPAILQPPKKPMRG